MVVTHPNYRFEDYSKFRLTYTGGKSFVESYLEKFSEKETEASFATRKKLTYCPAFAKAAINDIINPIFQRMSDIARVGGSEAYQMAVRGHNGGVDGEGSSANSYIGRIILEELLVLGKVGVYVDAPSSVGRTRLEARNKTPYIYYYPAEDIQNWDCQGQKFTQLVLRDYVYKYNEADLPYATTERYRHMYINESGYVQVRWTMDGESSEEILPIREIPFVLFDIGQSLLVDVCDHQIALLNLESSDIDYLISSNFPNYVEQMDMQTISNPLIKSQDSEIKLGGKKGRRIPKNVDFPRFIHPSSEPIKVAMEKEEQIKKDIRLLVNLAITNIQPKMASAESKAADNFSLESGLSAIGLELEQGERLIAHYWAMYEGSTPADVKYPRRYNLKTDKERLETAQTYIKSADNINSLTYKKELLKKAAEIQLVHEVSDATLDTIKNEIDSLPVIITNPEYLMSDIEKGLVSNNTASQARGYPKGESELAAEDHAERIKRIAESQGQARGTPDLSGVADASSDEKEGKEKRG